MDDAVETQAGEFLARFTRAQWSEFRDGMKTLPEDVARVVARLRHASERQEMEALFGPECAGVPYPPEVSPSGEYQLEVTPYTVKDAGSYYTRGRVSRLENGEWKPLAFDVKRNYSAFPYLFVEGHASGRDLLVCGEDYQGQTVLELDTGARWDFLPFDAVFGWGFCWAGYEYDPTSQLLLVEGCLWACPEEYRLYDFSEPSKAWPEVEFVDEAGVAMVVDYDVKRPTIEGDIVKCYQTEAPEGDDPKAERLVIAIQTFKRATNKLVFQSEWVSDAETASRQRREEARLKHEAWVQNLKTTDPLFLLAKQRAQNLPGKPPHALGIGVIYKGWCPTYEPDEQESRICLDLVQTEPLTICLEWGAEKGPVKLKVYAEGKNADTRFFMEHSIAAMNQAFDYVDSLVAACRTP